MEVLKYKTWAIILKGFFLFEEVKHEQYFEAIAMLLKTCKNKFCALWIVHFDEILPVEITECYRFSVKVCYVSCFHLR